VTTHDGIPLPGSDSAPGLNPAGQGLAGFARRSLRASGGQAAVLGIAGVGAIVAALSVAAVGGTLPLVLLAGLAVGVVMLQRPDIATPVFLFVLYLNLPVIATQFYGVPPFIAAAFAMILLVPFGSHVLLRREPLVVTPALWFLLAFLGAQLLSTFASANVTSSWNEVAVFMSEGLVLYVLVSNVLRTPEAIRRAIWVLLVAGALMGGLSVWQEVTRTYGNDYGGLAQINSAGFNIGDTLDKVLRPRLAGPIGEQNRYAQILIVLVPLGFFRVIDEPRRALRIAAAVCTVIITAAMFLTFSRGAFVAIVGLVLVAAVLRYIRLRQLVAVTLAGAVVMAVVAPSYLTRIESIVGVSSFVGDTTPNPDGAVLGRATSNLAALNAFIDHPLVGVGPGQYFRALSNQYGNELGLRHFEGDRRAHNLYLETGADLGIIGLAAFMGTVGATLLGLWRARRRWLGIRPDLADLATAFWFSVLAYLFTAVFLHLSYERYLWVLMAMAAAASWVLLRLPLPVAARAAERTGAGSVTPGGTPAPDGTASAQEG